MDQFKSPAGLRYYSNTTELISPELSCIALRATYPPLDNSFRVGPGEEQPTTPDNCEAFPRWNSTVDIMLVSFIVAAMALPFKVITLAFCMLFGLCALVSERFNSSGQSISRLFANDLVLRLSSLVCHRLF